MERKTYCLIVNSKSYNVKYKKKKKSIQKIIYYLKVFHTCLLEIVFIFFLC